MHDLSVENVYYIKASFFGIPNFMPARRCNGMKQDHRSTHANCETLRLQGEA